jgi:hypothetical protein
MTSISVYPSAPATLCRVEELTLACPPPGRGVGVYMAALMISHLVKLDHTKWSIEWAPLMWTARGNEVGIEGQRKKE